MTDNSVTLRDPPSALVLSNQLEPHENLCAALGISGWNFENVTVEAKIPAFALQQDAALIVLNLPGSHDILDSYTQALRSAPGSIAAVPILALQRASSNDGPIPIHVDGFLMDQMAPDSIVRELERWRPVSLEPTKRIAEMFGHGPTASMIERLARRLEPALASMERGVIDRSEAHRLAGLCGTLGFGQAHAAWLDISLGTSQ